MLDLIALIPEVGQWINFAVFLMIPFSVVGLAILLIVNGVTMMRRELRSLGNMLSLFAGIALIFLPVAAVAMVLSQQPVLIGMAGIAFFVSSYLGLVFVSFLCFTIAYARIRPRTNAAAVVVLGSGLVRGELTKLLKARMDRGYAEWERQRNAGNTALFIPSGGQGPNEPRPEATAMAEYVAPKLPIGVLAPETESRTTEENIELSEGVIFARGGDGPMVVVTNNYHVPRAALLTQRMGVPADVIGAPTARYYLPSAYLREFIAVVSYHPKVHAILLGPFLLGTILLTYLVGG